MKTHKKARHRLKVALVLAAPVLATLVIAGPARAADPVTVTVWSWTPVTPTMNAMIAAIEKAHPDIHVQAQIQPHGAYSVSLQAAAGSGNLPDIVGLAPGAETQQYRPHLLKLGAVAASLWGADWQKNFAPSLLSEARFGNPPGDDDFYALPQEAQINNLWYSIPAFKKAGMEGPPKSMAELVADADKLRSAGLIPFYQGGASGIFDVWLYLEIAVQTDPDSMVAAENGAAVWTKPGMVQAARTWEQLFTAKVLQPGALSAVQYPVGANLFAAGRVGMISLGSWWLQQAQLSDQPGLKTMADYGTFTFPALQEGGAPAGPIGGVDFGWGITDTAAKSPEVLAAAKIVLREMISGVGEQEALNQLNDLPAFGGKSPSQTLSPHLAEIYDTYIKQLATARTHVIGNPVINQSLITNLQAIGAGQITPEAAMAAVQATATAQGEAK
jgi:raffinose/stachyose/melibiose transport system substrate-binding protein